MPGASRRGRSVAGGSMACAWALLGGALLVMLAGKGLRRAGTEVPGRGGGRCRWCPVLVVPGADGARARW